MKFYSTPTRDEAATHYAPLVFSKTTGPAKRSGRAVSTGPASESSLGSARGPQIASELNRYAVLGYDRADRSDGVAGQCESRYALQFDMPMR